MLLLALIALRFDTAAQEITLPVITPENADQLELITAVGQGRGPYTLAWSPDGSQVALTTVLGTWLYEAADLGAAPRLIADRYVPAYSPDGSLIAFREGRTGTTITVLDAAAETIVATYDTGGPAIIDALAWDATGQFLAVADSGLGLTPSVVQVWDNAASTQVMVLDVEAYRLTTVALSAGGQWVAAGSDVGQVTVWNVATEDQDFSQNLTMDDDDSADNPITSLTFNGDILFALNSHGTTLAWEVGAEGAASGAEGAAGGSLSDDPMVGAPSALDSMGTQAVIQLADGTLLLWEFATHAEIARLEWYTALLHALAFSPDGSTLIFLGADNRLRTWDVTLGEPGQVVRFDGHMGPITTVAVPQDGMSMMSSSVGGGLMYWTIPDLSFRSVYYDLNTVILDIVYSPDGRTIVYDRWEGSASSPAQRSILLQPVDGSDPVHIPLDVGSIGSPAFSPSGGLLAFVDGDTQVRVWDVALAAEVITIDVDQPIRDLDVLTDDYLITAHADDQVRVWEIADGALLLELDGRDFAVSQARGHFAISLRGTGEVVILDSASFEVINRFPVVGVLTAFSPAGDMLVTSEIGRLTLWNADTGETLTTLDAQASSLAFDPAGRYLITGGSDGVLRSWGVAAGEG
jgi:WD40 repeat protein